MWRGLKELGRPGIGTVEEANRLLRSHDVGKTKRQFRVPAARPGDAFVPLHGPNPNHIFSVRRERRLAKDITVRLGGSRWADRANALPRHPGRLSRDSLRALGTALLWKRVKRTSCLRGIGRNE